MELEITRKMWLAFELKSFPSPVMDFINFNQAHQQFEREYAE